MRTIIIIVTGFVLLGVCVLAARMFGDVSRPLVMAAQIFIPIWLIAALVNMWAGVASAGYSVAEEFPIFLLIFAIPAAAAGLVWWKFF
jgi:hypothetical protein